MLWIQQHPKIQFFLLLGVFIPLCVMFVSLMFGALLAYQEEWKWHEGFYYVVGNVVGLATPLTAVEPGDDFGKIIDIVIAVWSLSITGCAIGIIGGSALVQQFIQYAEQGQTASFSSEDAEALIKATEGKGGLGFLDFVKEMDKLGWHTSGE